MEIRQLTMDDFEERMALSQFAFQFQLTPESLESRRKKYLPEQDWGAFDENGEMLSALMLIPLETWIQGKLFAMGGIAGVATWPEARRQGCVSKLLVRTLETMKNNGQTISMLHPFAFGFYRKFGYEFTIERKKYTIETRKLPPRLETPGQVKRMPKPDIELLNAVYTAYASLYSGTLVRTWDWWENRILTKTGSFAVYYNEDDKPEGYVFYQIESGKMTIHDWASTTETSRVALWTFVGNHDSMITETSLVAAIDDPLPFLLADPRVKQEVIPYFMSRIVDAEAFVGQYPWASGAREEAVSLRLSDAHAPWNDGLFRLVWSADGEGRLMRVEDEGALSAGWGTPEEAVACDIQALTAMLAGNRKPSLLREVGRISGPEAGIALLERRIPERTTHLMDFF
ncbi:GNAT family N-acetyltransferase [Cohnella endophytica]|uniref:GNAT family N-acetyltransferase n=1 Tax=Cohnella endophytica TaxID=2419778 RepID=A0A494XJ83_9BACL|nr:GNAT family N-acetyltransferase [Cohnella endophytica]RKP49822.1 GNAT family N-acetyltransferase [Cohnella endophytica]